MELPIPIRIKQVWDEWNIPVFLLLSLFLQALSLFLAPFRKRSRNRWLMSLIWLSYMATDWAPGFVIGLITNTVTSSTIHDNPREGYHTILTFWAPFLLLHLGGADTITSFALEDNELWIRYVFAFVFQILASAYIFYLSLPQNPLWPPTLLIFLAGTIKCIEWARAQFLATRDNFKNSRPLVVEILENEKSSEEISSDSIITTAGSDHDAAATKLKSSDVVKYAYHLFETYRGLIVGQKFTPEEYKTSQDLVCHMIKDGNEAFRVVEAEIYMIYEVLHTKAPLFRSKKLVISRFVYWVSLLTALSNFAFMDKKGFRSVDVSVTYVLFLGTIFLDGIGLLIMIFSSYLVIASMSEYLIDSPIWGIILLRPSELVMQIWSRCFPQTMQQYNLISHCRQQRSRKCQRLLRFLGLVRYLDQVKYVSEVPLPLAQRLRCIIYSKAQPVLGLPQRKTHPQLSRRVHWAYHFPYPTDSCHRLFYETRDEEFLIIFHIATEICCNTDDNDRQDEISINNLKSNCVKDFRVWCKLLSDYVLYLVTFKPSCLSAVSGDEYQKIIEETLDEAAELLFRGKKNKQLNQRNACEKILGLAAKNRSTLINNDEVVADQCEKGNYKLKDESILYRASELANELISSQDAYCRWSRMFDVWMERLLQAARWSRPDFHAQNLGNGGEFLTSVWLLMAHLGSGSQYQLVDEDQLNFVRPVRQQLYRPDSPQRDHNE